jgi:hypothetical protein
MMSLREELSGILYEGGYDDFTVNAENLRNNPDIERNKRMKYAYLAATNPETFEVMAKNNVILFHGTKSSALPNILKYGMNSVNELSKKGIEATTGEKWSRINGQRSFISFTDDLSVACSYASSQSQEDSFGALIGMSTSSTEKLKSFCVSSDLPELGIKDSVSLEHIKVIGVPKNKKEFVKRLVGSENIDVVDFDLEDPFYSMELTSKQALQYIEGMQEKGKEGQNKSEKDEFSRSDVKSLANSRLLSSIMNLYKSISEKVRGKGDEGYER